MNIDKKYNVIYADPPWSYKSRNGRDFKHGSAQEYDTMTIDELKEFKIDHLLEDNVACFLWSTVPLLPEALEVLRSWGFTYKTKLTWDKKSITTGFWFRNQVEDILVGVRGNVKPFRCQKANIHQCMYGKHSQKPHYFRELISEAVHKSFDEPKKLELFARKRDGLFPDYE